MFRLSINSEQVELNEKTRLQLSRLFLDLSDISKRGITISNSILIPFTGKNDRLLGFPSRLNSNNNAFEENQLYLLTQQNSIVSTGQVVIKSFDIKKGIKVQLVEGYDFWNSIGKKRMIDLSLFEFNIPFNDGSFNALSSKTDSPFLWGLASFAGDISETALDNLQYSRPQYRSRILIDQIINQSGYSINYTNTFESTQLDDIGLLSNTRNFAVTDYRRSWVNETIPVGDVNQSSGNSETSINGNTALQGNNLVNEAYATSYVIKGQVTAAISTVILVSYTLNGVTTTERVDVPTGTSFINFRTEEIEIDSETVFSVSNEIVFDDVMIFAHITETDIVEIEEDWKGSGQQSILQPLEILTDYNLPSMTQLEFFKVIIKQLFLKVDVDNLKKEITITPFSEVLQSGNVIDLTGRTKRFPSVSSGNIFGQLNILKYENEDDISEDIGKATFNIENNNALQVKEFLTISEGSASKEIQVANNTTVDVKIYTISPAERVSVKTRFVNFITGDGIDFSAAFAGIGWQNLYSKYYIQLVSAISRERSLPVEMLLSSLDLARINDSPIAYIGELKGNYLITKVSGFEEGEFSKVQMIKYG